MELCGFGIIILLLISNLMNHATGKSSAPGKPQPNPCDKFKIFSKIHDKFHIPIPTGRIDSSTIAVQLRTKTEVISLKATNPNLANFITQYYSAATRTISSYEQRRGVPWLIEPMKYIFSSYYYDFLKDFGLKCSCIGYYAGANKNFGSIARIKQLENRLQSLNHSRSQVIVRYFDGLNGDNYLQLLGNDIQPVPLNEPDFRNNNARQISCDAIFIKRQDGPNLFELPQITTLQPTNLKIPGIKRIFNTGSTENLVQQLITYYTNGLTCLEQQPLKSAFKAQFANWISVQLLPTMLQSDSCLQGFPSILGLLKSLKSKEPMPRRAGSDYANANANGPSPQNGYNQPQQQKQIFGRVYPDPGYPVQSRGVWNQYPQNGYQPPFIPPPGPLENEVHKILPLLVQGDQPQSFPYSSDSDSSTNSTSGNTMAAGFGFGVILMIIILLLFALFYFCYPPEMSSNLKRTRARVRNWAQKRINKMLEPRPKPFGYQQFGTNAKSVKISNNDKPKRKIKAKERKVRKDHFTVRNTESGYTTVTIEQESPGTSSECNSSSEELLKKSKKHRKLRNRRSRSELLSTSDRIRNRKSNLRRPKSHHNHNEQQQQQRGNHEENSEYDSNAEWFRKYNAPWN